MRLLREMETIQVDITNACIHECSNCSRMCGNHKKPFFMDFITFKAAIDSLEEFEGMIGIIGGEPVIHPEFDRFMEYAGRVRKERIVQDQYFHKPKKDYLQAMYSYSAVMKQIAKARGIVLTSSMPKQYYRHYERITDTATFYRINDHSKPSYHQPSMISYKDLGIPYEEFLKLRDNCWLHGKWSATIMPKGAFFCEMAGALDQLFEGPGGWTIEPGWWKREIEEYADQWHWCELCGMCLSTCTRDANEEIDDVSETLYHMLEKIGSPRVRKGKVSIYTAKEQDERSKATIAGNYMIDYRERLGAAKTNLLPKSIEIISFAELEQIRENRIKSKKHDEQHITQEGEEISAKKEQWDWVMLLPEALQEKDTVPKTYEYVQKTLHNLVQNLKTMFMNPGVLYTVEITDEKTADETADAKMASSEEKMAQAKLFNVNASELKRIMDKAMDGVVKTDWFAALEEWDEKKQYILRKGFENDQDVDMSFYEDEMLRGYQGDEAFMNQLRKKLDNVRLIKEEKNGETRRHEVTSSATIPAILLPMVSNLQNMRAVTRLLLMLDCDVHIMAGCNHQQGLSGLLPPDKLHFFDHEKFEYQKLAKFTDTIKGSIAFDGCILPTSATADHLINWDGYDDAIRLMERMELPIIGIINAKRRFCAI